jgi:transposase
MYIPFAMTAILKIEQLASVIHPLRADYYPILGHLMNELHLPDRINKIVEPPSSQSILDPGTFVALIIHHVLGDVNLKLYRMYEFFEDKALPLMIPWKSDIALAEINDDRAGRVLDEIWRAGPQKVFSTVVDAAIQYHALQTDTIHADTTSKSFYGAFEQQNDCQGVPMITYGHSKDSHPDLKQILFDVGTTQDGIPIIAEVDHGNASDMAINGRWVRNMRTILKKDDDEFLLYVADSALVTTENLAIRKDLHIDILSRLPGRFGLEEELQKRAIQADQWENIGRLSNDKKAARYKLFDTTGEIEGITYRFVVVHSDHKDQRKEKALKKAVKKEYDSGMNALNELANRGFVCEQDASIEIDKAMKKLNHEYHTVEWSIKPQTEKMKRDKRGRPRKDESVDEQTRYYVIGSMKLDQAKYELESQLCGLFVLITTLMDHKKYPAKLLLEKYKGQDQVERIFRFIKNPAWIGAFCLKTPERIVALGYILLMAAVIYTLWERRVRKILMDKNIEPIEGLNRQPTHKPTAFAMQIIMSALLVQSTVVDDKLLIWLPRPLKRNQRRVVEMSGFSESIYSGSWDIRRKNHNPIES